MYFKMVSGSSYRTSDIEVSERPHHAADIQRITEGEMESKLKELKMVLKPWFQWIIT